MKISAIILSRNEAPRIGTCLEALSWTDEQILVDNGSTDDTIKIAKKLRVRVVNCSKKSFAERRNVGLREAKGDWVFYVDADETVTENLSTEIKKNVSQPTTHNVQPPLAAFIVRRKNFYLGHHWPYQEKILRLFRKTALKEWHGELHESPRVDGEIGELSSPLLHNTHRTLEEMVAKTNEWSDTEAVLRLRSGHPPVVWWRFLRVMLTAFFDSFIKQGGWRTGTVGWIESIYQAFSIFITYVKLWELQQKKKL